MKVLMNYIFLLIAGLSGIAIAGTLLSSPDAVSETGLPTIRLNTSKTVTGLPNIYTWPNERFNPNEVIDKPSIQTSTIGLIVSTTPLDNVEAQEPLALIRDWHKSQSSPSWIDSLSVELNQLPSVQFAWIAPLSSTANSMNVKNCQQALTDAKNEIKSRESSMKDYEIKTALLADQLKKQWMEQLLRQSSEDLQTLTLMRARSNQDLRLRLAKSQHDDARIRMEGLTSVEAVRLNYIGQLNDILKSVKSPKILPVLERHSLFLDAPTP